jgi:hypothetical protein
MPIKGHVIGESFQQFVGRTAHLSDYLTRCAGVATEKQARKAKVSVTLCNDYADALAGRDGVKVPLGDGLVHDDIFDVALDYGIFSGGKLGQLSVWRHAVGYADVLSDMKARFGEPTGTDVETRQNAYGAQFQFRSATWVRDSVIAMASESGEIHDVSVVIMVSLKSELERQSRARQSQRVDTLK